MGLVVGVVGHACLMMDLYLNEWETPLSMIE
jgi:hypothetical protein